MSGPKPEFKFFSEASVSVINVFSEVMMQKKKKKKILIGRDIRGNCKGSEVARPFPPCGGLRTRSK